jgi:pimeloyl-ACP methyl ester carboxylesterase
MNIVKLAALGLTASIVAASAGAATPAGADTAKPSVVIVHGAFADGSDWAKVVPLLQAKGLHVVAVQNPLSSLADDVATAKRVIDAQPGKVVLVGHSWGGMVITEAGDSPKVAGLVYVAAFAPDAGQSVGDVGKGFAPGAGLAHLVADGGGFLSLTQEGMSKHFAQDLPAAATAVMTATQGPINAKAFEQKVSVAAWKQKPSWYLVTEADHMIVPEQQRAMAKAINAKVSSVASSHVPQQSQPAKVAAVILDAVQAVQAAQ